MQHFIKVYTVCLIKLEDLKVLRRSPDLLNNVVIGQGKLQLIMEQILFYHMSQCQNSSNFERSKRKNMN